LLITIKKDIGDFCFLLHPTQTVQDLLDRARHLCDQQIQLSQLTSSVSAGAFKPNETDLNQTLQDAGLANGTVFTLPTPVLVERD